MSKHAKTLEKMRNNPRDWRIDDLVTLASHYQIEIRNEGGSHHVFSHASIADAICVPAHRPIKPVYVRLFVELIDSVKEQQP